MYCVVRECNEFGYENYNQPHRKLYVMLDELSAFDQWYHHADFIVELSKGNRRILETNLF